MKKRTSILAILFIQCIALSVHAQTSADNSGTQHLYLDVHKLEPGSVTFSDVEAAHQKDLATEAKYGVQFLKFWVDEKEGLVYCLSSASDSADIKQTHAEAHGLIPDHIYEVTDGTADQMLSGKKLFLDIHYLGAGNVTATAVAGAHEKDLATQSKYGVHFINYWVDEAEGVVICLSQADEAEDVIKTHTEAHGLIPTEVLEVQEGM
ncbi:MAG: DUF4242 domain-containing protein [Chitinophagales bacterium]